ncbi:MAG: autotransporter-associated beta strand repeat-containing protein, partial [Rariglobus sp.]
FTNSGSPTYSSPASAGALTLGGTNTGANTFAGVLTNPSSNTTSLTKSGSGTWILTATNTYTGGTVITEGTLETGATGSFGNGNVTVASGAFLTAGNATSFADTATLTFSSNSLAGSISLSAGIDTIGAVYNSISATYMIAGTHDATALNNFFGTNVFTGPGSLTVSAIPEPSTYALLIGIGGLTLASLRRRSA